MLKIEPYEIVYELKIWNNKNKSILIILQKLTIASSWNIRYLFYVHKYKLFEWNLYLHWNINTHWVKLCMFLFLHKANTIYVCEFI